MKHTFLITTAAAALLAGTALTSAQTSMDRAVPPASEQKAAPEVKSDTKAQGDIKAQSKDQKGSMGAQIKADEKPAMNAQAPAKAGSKNETTGQAAPSKDIKAQDTKDIKARDTKAQDTQKSDTKVDSKTQGMQKQDSTAQQKSGADSKSSTTVQSDTKSGSASSGSVSANVTLNAEQKTKIRETVIKAPNAPRVANVNFKLTIGTPVPKTVRFAPLPTYLVEIQPSWRGYEYFLVGDEIVVVNPRTLEIVAILQV